MAFSRQGEDLVVPLNVWSHAMPLAERELDLILWLAPDSSRFLSEADPIFPRLILEDVSDVRPL